MPRLVMENNSLNPRCGWENDDPQTNTRLREQFTQAGRLQRELEGQR
jgi:hypothetical protein